jgi:hypothetical protein
MEISKLVINHHASDINVDSSFWVFFLGVGAVTAVESSPAVALRPSTAVKPSRADGSMKAPSARPAKKARQDAFDPMDPVCS